MLLAGSLVSYSDSVKPLYNCSDLICTHKYMMCSTSTCINASLDVRYHDNTLAISSCTTGHKNNIATVASPPNLHSPWISLRELEPTIISHLSYLF